MSLSSRASRTIIAVFTAGLMIGAVGTGMASSMLGSSIFPDVTSGSYYDDAIGQMYGMGIIKGYQNGNFGPDDPVTRGQLAVMLQRFYNEEHGISNNASSASSARSVVRSSSSSSTSSSSSSSSVLYGTVRFTTSNFTVNKGTATATVSIVRIGGANGQLTVNYATGSGSAIAGTDFNPTSGTLSFANGDTSKTFTVTLINNPLAQSDRQIPITLSNISPGAGLGNPSSAVITIIANPNASSTSSTSSSSSSANPAGVLSFAANGYLMDEKVGSVSVTVNRTGGTTGTVSVAYGTTDGTAHAGADYSAVSGTLTFNSGETTKSFSIPLSYNSNVTGNKTFSIAIGSPTGGATLDTAAATVTIYDHESGAFGSGALRFAKSEYDVSKADGQVQVVVQRTGGASGTVTVNYDTESVSASSGTDYTEENGTLTFAPGESSKIITIPILNNGSLTNSRSFNVALSSPSAPATLIAPYVASVVISN